MFNYYLYNKSYEGVPSHLLEENLQTLNDLVISERDEFDYFLKHDSIWEVQTAEGCFADVVFSRFNDIQFSQTVLPKLFQSIDSIEDEITTLEEFDKRYKIYNAFYGIQFSNIDLSRCISSKPVYQKFRDRNLLDITPDSLWERREQLFHNIIFCNNVQSDIRQLGNAYLAQITKRIKELDQYITSYYTEGAFDYHDANNKTSLRISPESSKTMGQEKYYNLRVFAMPDGRRECFELHIKTGDLRFHFFPENGKVYIGYIGKHLATDKYN